MGKQEGIRNSWSLSLFHSAPVNCKHTAGWRKMDRNASDGALGALLTYLTLYRPWIDYSELWEGFNFCRWVKVYSRKRCSGEGGPERTQGGRLSWGETWFWRAPVRAAARGGGTGRARRLPALSAHPWGERGRLKPRGGSPGGSY